MTDALVTAEELRATLAAFEKTQPATHRQPKKLATVGVIAGLLAMVAGFMFARWNQHTDNPAPAALSRVTTEQAAATYRVAVAPVNAAYTPFVERAARWGPSTTSTDAATDARPLSAALRQVVSDVRSLADTYPAGASTLEASVRAASSVEADLVALDRLNAGLSVDEWMHQFRSDVDELTTASNAVRSELGLPPALTNPNLVRG